MNRWGTRWKPDPTASPVCAERVLQERPDTRIVVISGHPDTPGAKRALEAGARTVVGKPFEIGTILDHLG